MDTPRSGFSVAASKPMHLSPSPRRADGFVFNEDESMRRLHDENVFLQRKIKYMHSVSTIFRQKIALIMREMSRNPGSAAFVEQHRNYTQALTELTRAEAEGDILPPPDADVSMPTSLRAVSLSGVERTQKAKEDIAKAHQLCIILQEKNDLKQSEIQLRADLQKSRDEYAELYERHQRVVELQSTATGSTTAAQAQAEIFREKETALQRQLERAQTEILQLRANRVMPPGAGLDDAAMSKQNTLLKARIAKLKEELGVALDQGSKNAQQMNDDVDRLVGQLQAARHEVESRDRIIRVVRHEKNELAKELVSTRSNFDYLKQQLGAVEHLKGVSESVTGALQTKDDSAEIAELRATVTRLGTKLGQVEADGVSLKELLLTERTANAQKDAEISALGAQLRAFRARMEAHEADSSQRELQQSLIVDVESRVLAAVQDIRKAQTTETLSKQVGAIQKQLARLEGVEMQLRQKEDAIALMEDEAAQIRRSHDELESALLAISALFVHFPRSVEALERLVIELEEYREEVRRSAERREVPDLLRVEGAVELRCLEAETQRRSKREETSDLGILGDGDLGGLDGGDHSAEFVQPSLDIPGPPALIDITQPWMHDEDLARWGDGSASGGDAAAKGRNDGFGNTGVSEEDVALTFQLFDERNTGILPIDAIRLCLTTLGLPAAQAPTHCASMTAAEFLALTMKLKRPAAAANGGKA